MTETPDTSRESVEQSLKLAVINRHITPAFMALGLALLARAEKAEAAARESALQELASLGQAAEAYDAQLKAYAACDEWASVSQDNYQRAKKAEVERDALQAEVERLKAALTVIGHCNLSCCETMDAENRRHARAALEATPTP